MYTWSKEDLKISSEEMIGMEYRCSNNRKDIMEAYNRGVSDCWRSIYSSLSKDEVLTQKEDFINQVKYMCDIKGD